MPSRASLCGGSRCDRRAVKPNAALPGTHQPHDCFQGGAFADAIAAEQPDHLALADLQRHAVQDVALAVKGVHILDRDQRRVWFAGVAHVFR